MPTPSLISFNQFDDSNGVLCIYESKERVPFTIARVFTVNAKKGNVRGKHAHWLCSQLLVCLLGEIVVSCDTGSRVEKFTLNTPDIGLLIPPLIWASQEYVLDNSILMVLCDRPYESNDYIHNYSHFQSSAVV
jgi:dTDP-4-dehydrorhamnose 3,5-epimerase-like enzyme